MSQPMYVLSRSGQEEFILLMTVWLLVSWVFQGRQQIFSALGLSRMSTNNGSVPRLSKNYSFYV